MFEKLSLSGYRAKPGFDFDLNKVSELVQAFATYIGEGQKVAIGIDKKKSSPMIKYCILSSLIAGGLEVYDLGECTTAQLQIFVSEKKLKAGIMVGGFSPEEVNGIRFFRNDGMQFSNAEMQIVLNIYFLKKFVLSKWDKLGKVVKTNEHRDIYLKRIKKVIPEIEKLRDLKIKIGIKGNAQTSIECLEELLKESGLKINNKKPDILVQINSDNAIDFIKINNKVLNQIKIIWLIVRTLSKQKKIKVVSNTGLSQSIREIEKTEIIETKAGMQFIAETVLNEMADIGIEGCGSVLFPEFLFGYDAVFTFMFLLASVLKDIDLEEELKQFSEYNQIKKFISIKPEIANCVLNELKMFLNKKYKIETMDGIKIKNKDMWVTVRISNNENFIKILSEYKNKKDKKLIDVIEKFINKSVNKYAN
jgi:phosphomannomutase/phosphoglucomutase